MTKEMFIEIRGTNFTNKGAELMLHAIVRKVGERVAGAKFVHRPTGKEHRKKFLQLGLYQKTSVSQDRISSGMNIAKYFPLLRGKPSRVVNASQIKVAFDASGFRYSDQFGEQKCISMVQLCQEWKKNGAKIIFLPQAFGPFSSSVIREAFTAITEMVDLIYARDKVSYDYVTELTGKRDNIKICPDFTNLVNGVVPHYFSPEVVKVCVIPNYRMIDKTSSEQGRKYLSFLSHCTRYLKEKGEDFFILIHEGKKDLWLAKEITRNIRSNKAIKIIKETDPLKIKGIIGKCKGLISSRFHGLVSGLSQGVPSLGAGWSHKYGMLFDDYGFPQGVLSVERSYDEIKAAIDLIVEEPSCSQIRNGLVLKANEQKKIVERMWEEVFQMILPG